MSPYAAGVRTHLARDVPLPFNRPNSDIYHQKAKLCAADPPPATFAEYCMGVLMQRMVASEIADRGGDGPQIVKQPDVVGDFANIGPELAPFGKEII